MDRDNLVQAFKHKFREDPIRFDDLPGTTSRWDCHKLVRLYAMKDSEESTHEKLAESLGFERSSITRKISGTDWEEFEKKLERLCTISHEEYMDEAAGDYRLKTLANIAIKRRKHEISTKAQLKHIYDILAQKISPLEPVKLPFNTKTRARRDRTPEHMILLLSDTHVGQEFTLADTGGLTEYNVEIFTRRATNLIEAVIDIYNLHSQLYRIPELHVLGLGDVVQGDNKSGQWGSAYNASSVPVDEQVILASDVMAKMLSVWSNVFEKVIFNGVVGNHGRTGAYNTEKVRTNWDNIAYALLQGRMSGHRNVSVEYKPAWWEVKKINGTGFCLVHGDDLRKNITSIMSDEQRIASLLRRKQESFNVLVAGHFHSFQEIETTNGMILLNGSFVGGDIFSMKNLKSCSRPTQTILGVHPEHGVTWKYNLDMDLHRKGSDVHPTRTRHA